MSDRSLPGIPTDAGKKSGGGCFVGCLGVLGAGIVLAVIFGVWNSTQDHSDNDAESDRLQAEWACEGAVEQNLKAPTTADYQSTASGAGPWTVTGTVDAENGFGAKVRTTYTCNVVLSGNEMLATLESIG